MQSILGLDKVYVSQDVSVYSDKCGSNITAIIVFARFIYKINPAVEVGVIDTLKGALYSLYKVP